MKISISDRSIFILCGVLFFALCLLHFFSLREFWVDEEFIIKNIQDLSYNQLFGPLKYAQAFPRFYLIVIKAVTEQFAYSTISLRLFPLISMFLSFFVWAKVYSQRLSSKWGFFLALFSFSASYYLSYYAAELKQYSMDVLVVGIFVLFLSYQKNFEFNKLTPNFIILSALLPFLIFFSYASLFAFWIVIYNFFLIFQKNKKILLPFCLYSLVSALIFSLFYILDLRHLLAEAGLFNYWNDYFLHSDSFYGFLKSFTEGLRRLSVWFFGSGKLFRSVFSFFIPFFIFGLFGYGYKSFRDNKFKVFDIECIGLIIFVQLFILGIIKKYPFTGERITLFFAPFVFITIVIAMGFFNKQKMLWLCLNGIYLIFIIFCYFSSILRYLKFYA